jgi:hypothetical protein
MVPHPPWSTRSVDPRSFYISEGRARPLGALRTAQRSVSSRIEPHARPALPKAKRWSMRSIDPTLVTRVSAFVLVYATPPREWIAARES